MFWLLSSGGRGAEIATVLALIVAVIGLAAPTLFRAPEHDHFALARAARALAQDVSTRQASEQQKLLADSGQTRPADVGFKQPELLYWRTDGAVQRGSLKEIEEFFTGLRHGRLVVLGEVGAGKTVLANQLLLDLTASLPKEEPAPGSTITVPVRLSLPSFDLKEGNAISAEQASNRLDDWISWYLTRVHGTAPRIARALVRQGWILPILDGLDEMDQTPTPTRAAAVIRGLNQPWGPGLRPVVITCRTEDYEQLCRVAAAPGQQPILQDATAVRIQPLTAAQVRSYLIGRFPDPADPQRAEPRWRPVVSRMTRHPGGSLSTTLSSPLYLFLAVTAYHATATRPAELAGLDAEHLRIQLLDKLIPAVTSQHPRQDGSIYDSACVTRWLASLADHLRARASHGESGSDINLHELWTAAGQRKPRYLAAGMLAFVAPAVMLLIDPTPLCNSYEAFLSHVFPWRFAYPGSFLYRAVIVYVVSFILVAPYVFWQARRIPVALDRFDPMMVLRARTGRRRLLTGITFGLVTWLLFVDALLSFGSPPGTLFGLITSRYGPNPYFLMLSLTAGLAIGLTNRPAAISRPRQLVRQGIGHDIAVLVAFPLAVAVATGLISDNPDWPLFIPFGLMLGVTWLSDSPWPRYTVAAGILARRGLLPRRPAAFLDWAYEAGLLRLAGTAVQFRHRELQEQLAGSRHGSPPESPLAQLKKQE